MKEKIKLEDLKVQNFGTSDNLSLGETKQLVDKHWDHTQDLYFAPVLAWSDYDDCPPGTGTNGQTVCFHCPSIQDPYCPTDGCTEGGCGPQNTDPGWCYEPTHPAYC